MQEAAPGAASRLILEGPFTRTEPAPDTTRNRRHTTGIRLHLQVQARAGDDAGCLGELSVAGDVTVPDARPHTLIQQGSAVLDPQTGLRLRLRWRSDDGPQSLVATPAASRRALTVTLHDDRDNRIIGTGTVPYSWRQVARSLGTVHATDTRSSAQATRWRTALAVALLRATQRTRPDRPKATALSVD